jgi:hypothetical protein
MRNARAAAGSRAIGTGVVGNRRSSRRKSSPFVGDFIASSSTMSKACARNHASAASPPCAQLVPR